MKLIICLDDNGGMLFNSRRQSRDRTVIADIIEALGEETLYVNEYSSKLFSEYEGRYSVVDGLSDILEKDALCFVENIDPSPYIDFITEVTVYRWNRVYPRDLCFNVDLSSEGFSLVSSRDFEGYSHEKITKEVFKR